MGWKAAAGHVVFALGYTAVAGVVTLSLPALHPGADPLLPWMAGGQLWLAGLLIHHLVWEARERLSLLKRLRRLRKNYEELAEIVLLMKRGQHGAARSDRNESAAALSDEAPAITDDPGDTLPVALVADDEAEVEGDPSEVTQAAEMLPVLPAPAATASLAPVAEPVPPMTSQTMAEVIRQALADNRQEVFLQPIVRLPQRRHRYYEILSRLRLPDGELLTPERFLPVARQERLVTSIDRVMLSRALNYAEETLRRGHAVGFFCNITALTLASAAHVVDECLDHFAVQPELAGRLILELHQPELAAMPESFSARMAELGRRGVRFSLDTIEQLDLDPYLLQSRHIHYLKLAPSLFAIAENKARIIELQPRLSAAAVTLIAEKIETEAQLADAVALGIDHASGVLFAQPRQGRRMG